MAILAGTKCFGQLGISREAQERLESQLQEVQQQLADQRKRTEELESQLEQAANKETKRLDSLVEQKKTGADCKDNLNKVQQQLVAQQKRIRAA